MIILKDQKPFAKGGNRLCFVHPNNPDLCIKVRRPDFTLEDLRKKKGFPKSLRPLYMFDDNREEFQVISSLEKDIGKHIFQHIYRCYGFVETDMGKGLVTELIWDGDGQISLSLKQYISDIGWTESCQQALVDLLEFWKDNLIPSRELLTHNIVVQCNANGKINRFVVIDGLGNPNIIPYRFWPKTLKKNKIMAKAVRLYQRIEKFCAECDAGKIPSHVGRLLVRQKR